jgi:hypothetical protein
MKITKSRAKLLAKKYKINTDIVPFDEFHFGLNVELEHGNKLSKLTNVTNNSLNMTTKIVIAHLLEDPRYYKYLKKMEEKRELYWSKHKKPCIFKEIQENNQ